MSFHEKEWLDNCPDSFKPIFSAAMLMNRLYCLTHVIVLFFSLITLTQNIPTLNLLLKLKMMIKLCLFWISVLNVLIGILKHLFIENQPLLVFLQILKVFYRLLTKKVSFSLSCFVISTSAPPIKFFTLNLKNSRSYYFKMVTQDRCVNTFLDKMISPPLKVQTPTFQNYLFRLFYFIRRGGWTAN